MTKYDQDFERCPECGSVLIKDSKLIAAFRDFWKGRRGKPRKKFIPPTIKEVIAYVQEKDLNVDVGKFMGYYETTNWRDKNDRPIRNWKGKLVSVWDKPGKVNRTCRSIGCRGYGIYTTNDDTGQLCWWCENHKPAKKPAKLPAEMSGFGLVAQVSKRSVSDMVNEQRKKLGLR